MNFIDINTFISDKITKRDKSYFNVDLSAFESELSKKIEGSSFLVIGGAGTIGSSFIKAILKYKPGKIVVVDTNENGLTELVRDLRSTLGLLVPDNFITYPIDYGTAVFEKLFWKRGPFDVIANFAAHKHVRSEKDVFSIEAMFTNNIFSVDKLCQLALQSTPKHFFCVSTDKAANPVNVMGASKKIMEEVLMAYSRLLPISTARFANVAFSNGSLLHGFIERIIKKQPLSSPSDVKRYFVSPKEAGQLCMLACMLGSAGEVFFPKLREDQMMTFSDIAILLLKEFGFEALQCKSEEEAKLKAKRMENGTGKYPVFFFSSDTSGEKMFEEFATNEESPDMTRFQALGVISYKNKKTIEEAQHTSKALKTLFQNPDLDKIKVLEKVKELLPNFAHVETNKNLDQKM